MPRWRNRAELDDLAHRHLVDELRARAADRGITVKALAAAAGLSEAGLHRILAGERSPSLRTLCNLATVLSCAPSDLVP